MLNIRRFTTRRNGIGLPGGPRSTASAFRANHGFTLLELMIAMGLSVVVAGAAYALFNSSSRVYRQETKVGRMQQAGRVALDVIAQDLYRAGIGMISPFDADDETEMIFTDQGVQNSTAGDVLQFRSSDGHVAYVALDTSVSSGSSITFSVYPGSHLGFSVGDPMVFFNLDREYLGYGRVTGMSITADQLTCQLQFLSSGVTEFKQNTMLISAPYTVTYARSDEGGLYRCQGNVTNCPESSLAELIVDNVDVFQVSYYIRAIDVVGIPLDTDTQIGVDMALRKRITAVKLEVLLHSAQQDPLARDARTYWLGNNSFSPTGRYADGTYRSKYHRMPLSRVVNLMNLGL